MGRELGVREKRRGIWEEEGGVWSREEAVPGQRQPRVRNPSGQPSPAGLRREALQKGPKPDDLAAGERSQHYIPD